ncbi:uncharacterized protein LOC115763418 [Drosophila novamexicana]|uniref:uncharacterized protein LOC115763418 n=1 Tax=Drosophila novamexicana TaxID=47314 RepID=UPI0011E5CE28|nr:uncharacterized protein LOC115763418 [Drosophila novamexicana]
MDLSRYTFMVLVLVLLIHIRNARSADDDVLLECQLMLYANSEVTFGVETKLLITLAEYPKTTVVLRVSTARYLVAYWEIGRGAKPMRPSFTYSRKIGNDLKRRKIEPSVPVSYQTGFYAELKATFYESANTTLKLEGTAPLKKHVEPVQVVVSVSINTFSNCTPVLSVMHCSNPDFPQQVIITRSILFRAFFFRSCGLSDPILTWSVMDVLGKETLKSYPGEDMAFNLKSYELRYPMQFELWQNLYMLYVEGIFNGEKFGARCYLKTQQEKLEVIISGGTNREAFRGSKITLDGSLSRDYSKRPKETQFKVYNWDCFSYDDYYNTACRPDVSRVKKFGIAAYSFTFGCRYIFTLKVASDYDPGLKAQATQTITAVDTESLHIVIVCISNCYHNMYNPMNKVLLGGKCLNCQNAQTSYDWYLDDQKLHTSKKLSMIITTDKTIASLKLVVRTNDGRSGREVKSLTQNIPPLGGTCSVTPFKGIEAITQFLVCCISFQARNNPIEFFYYAERVLLNRCQDCSCSIHLPHNLNFIKVLICDSLFTCVRRMVRVTVTPLMHAPVDSPEALRIFITKPPNDVVNLANQGHMLRFLQTIQSLAAGVTNAESAMILIDAFNNINLESLAALGKLANLTHTLAVQLTPIDENEQVVLIRSLTILNKIFQSVHNNDMNRMLVEEPFVNVTVACVTVYNIMNRLNSQISRPPQDIYDRYFAALKKHKLQQSVVDRLMAIVAGYNNEDAKERSMTWLNSMWETERLYRFLFFARKHGMQPDFGGTNVDGLSLEVKCFNITPGRTYTIETTDHMHKVYFSPELLQEVKKPHKNEICIKVISTIRELNWWYPEEKQPSSVLLSVRIYHDRDDFKVERLLHHSKLSFRTIIGKYKPAMDRPNVVAGKKPVASRTIGTARFRPKAIDEDETEDFIAETGKYMNCITHGKLESMQKVLIYRVNVDETSMVAVRFTQTTHKLQVLLIFGDLPKRLRESIAKSGCIVPANSQNSTMLLRNNCMKSHRVYVAIQVYGSSEYEAKFSTPVPGGPAFFSFVFQLRSCDYWIYSLPGDSQRWGHTYCQPGMEYPKKGSMNCMCTVLGTYTSYVYHVPAIAVPSTGYLPVETHWYIVVGYFLLFVGLTLWLAVLFLYHNKRPSKTVVCDMTGLEDEAHRDVHDVLVFLKTGGRTNALTTATIRLIFQTTNRNELQFTLMQDPEHPELTRNSTYILWLRTRDIRIPTRVAVVHNNGGRYPSWFLRRIEVMDVQAQLTQVFIVQRWVHQKFLILSSSMVLRPGDGMITESWRERFNTEFERQWINWGLWQPVTGNWRESAAFDSLTRAERVCIFLNKMMVTYCVCACYMGPTTPETVYGDRRNLIQYRDFLPMFLICSVLTNVVHYVLEKLVLRKHKNSMLD